MFIRSTTPPIQTLLQLLRPYSGLEQKKRGTQDVEGMETVFHMSLRIETRNATRLLTPSIGIELLPFLIKLAHRRARVKK